MRVAQIAELTGTTVRTVRYYHSLGLLPVPAQRRGWRDYDLSHVARLSRIRWLVQAGVPLEAVGRILDGTAGAGGARDPQEGAVSRDLAEALASIETHLAQVRAQRDMLASLLERSRGGAPVSPMTPRMAAFFDWMEEAAPDERTREAVRTDRDVVDLACYRGQMPAAADLFFPDPDSDDAAASLAAYVAAGAGRSQQETEATARQMVERLAGRLEAHQLRALARDVDREEVRAVFALFASLETLDTGYARALERQLLELIDRWAEDADRADGSDPGGPGAERARARATPSRARRT